MRNKLSIFQLYNTTNLHRSCGNNRLHTQFHTPRKFSRYMGKVRMPTTSLNTRMANAMAENRELSMDRPPLLSPDLSSDENSVDTPGPIRQKKELAVPKAKLTSGKLGEGFFC